MSKTCGTCLKTLDIIRFYKDKTYKGGYQSKCRGCTQEHRRKKKLGLVLKPPSGHKKCSGCEVVKPYSEFWADKGNKSDGKYSHCKDCKTKATYKWRAENPELYNKTARDYRASLTFSERRDTDLKAWFGLPSGWYDTTLSTQNGVCASCGKSNPSKKRCLAVDHNHETGAVRGIICYGCNRLLRAFDHKDTRESLIKYLEKYDPSVYSVLKELLK